jgi:hypothetical protein
LVGEQVLLKLQHYAQNSVVNRAYHKLSYKFFGPFAVLEWVRVVAYRLQLPAEARIHQVFHVSQLKPFTPNYTPVFSELPRPPDLAALAVQPSAILRRRLVRAGNATTPQILVKWGNLPDESATSEDYYVLQRHFPQAPIWEGSSSQEGASVTPSPTVVPDERVLDQEGHNTESADQQGPPSGD